MSWTVSESNKDIQLKLRDFFFFFKFGIKFLLVLDNLVQLLLRAKFLYLPCVFFKDSSEAK